ncbi:APC family permease [Phytohabitans houttuyneae]|uniref:Amino acid permease n=1 Tax=Phytohabitans houttuyneae TaxID=1076126 RepID=A0A6V8JXK6_9ACTN|nr:amino acid permease [Phytohabitans houttuyneae]
MARTRMGVPSVMAFVLAAAAPLTVIAGSASTGYAVTGYVGVPVAYLTVGLVLAVFSVGYVAMARRVRQAGGFYTYVSLGLGRVPGVGAAMVSQLGYNALQISLYGAFGVVAAAVAQAQFGWRLGWWVYAVAGWALVAMLGLRSVKVNGRVLAALLVLELAVVVVFDLALIAHPAGGQVSFAALSPTQLSEAGAAAILVGGIAGFVGYEAAVVFSEEVKDPRRTVARATYLALALIAGLYGLSTWAMTVATGPTNIVAAAQRDGTDLFFYLAAPYLPAPLVDAGRILLLTSLGAALLAFHNMIARYTFCLSREGVLPQSWGRTSRRTGAPVYGSALQSLLAVGVLVVYIGQGLDPMRHLFFYGGVTGGLGVLILMTATSVAVVGYFARHRHAETVWRRLVAPVFSALVLLGILAATVSGFGELLDVSGHSPLRWLLPASFLAAAVAGVVWALILRRVRPTVYAVIGLGPDSLTVTSAPPQASHSLPVAGASHA